MNTQIQTSLEEPVQVSPRVITCLDENTTSGLRGESGSGVLSSLSARPSAKLAEMDLATDIQLSLAKSPPLLPRDLKAGMHPIRLVGECFHDLPLRYLSDAWLTWSGSRCQVQTEVDSGGSFSAA